MSSAVEERKEPMQISQKAAYRLVAEAAPYRYRGSALAILGKLVRMTYNPKIDDPQRQITDRGIGPLMRAGHVKERQFYKAMAQLRDVVQYERHDGKIDFKLNFEPLAAIDTDTERENARDASRKRRTEWARKTKADKRTRLHASLSLMIAAGVYGRILPKNVFEKQTEPDVTEPIPDPHPGLYRKLHPEVT
jgi:hypothetical protein